MTIARGSAGRAALVVSWIVLPLGVLAVVRIPNSDNHVRYVIETLPLAAIAIPYGATTLGRLLGWREAVVAALVTGALVVAVEATRGARLPDYRYRGDAWAQQKVTWPPEPGSCARTSRATTSSWATTRPSRRACSTPAATTRARSPAARPAPSRR